MPIRTSSARAIDALVTDLRSRDAVTQDAAIARLIVIGARAVDRLLTLVGDAAAPSIARSAAFRALEGIADPRTLTPALDVLRAPLGRRRDRASVGSDDEVAIAAVGVARAFLQGDAHVEALDALTATALDRQRSEAVRVAALRALEALDTATLRPIREALLTDGSPRLRAFAQGGSVDATEPSPPGGSWLDRLTHLAMPDDPDAVRHEIERRGAVISLSLLHRALEGIREREVQASTRTRRGWRAARMAVHVALAHQGSTVGLYDLREILDEADGPVAAPLLTAVGLIGDTSCLERLAELYAGHATGSTGSTGLPASPESAGEAWRHQIAEAFRAIVAREHLTPRHAVAKKIKARWPAQWAALWSR